MWVFTRVTPTQMANQGVLWTTVQTPLWTQEFGSLYSSMVLNNYQNQTQSELSVNDSNDFILHGPWTVWKRWKVKWHHWKAPRKSLCKSHSFFYSCAVPPNEQTREIISKRWWGCLFAFGFFFNRKCIIYYKKYYNIMWSKCRVPFISSI